MTPVLPSIPIAGFVAVEDLHMAFQHDNLDGQDDMIHGSISSTTVQATHANSYLPPFARSFISTDCEDDYSVISELSCELEFNPIIPLDVGSGIGCCTMQDSRMICYPSVVSSACTSPFPDSSMYDSEDDTMSTGSIEEDFTSLRPFPILCTDVNDRKEPPFLKDKTDVDALSLIPAELVCVVSSFLDVVSLSRTRLVSKRLLCLASSDEAGWRSHCEGLWSQKAHVPREAYSLLANGNARKAFHFAGREAVSRHHVSRDELCFNTITGRGIVWSFRFKAAAGTVWTSFDPWWSGRNARQMVFLDDGTVMQYVQRSSSTNDAHDLATRSDFRLMTPFHETRGDDRAVTGDEDGAIMGSAGHDVRWRFVSHPMGLPQRPDGAYIRLTVAGRDVPTYVVHRSPTGNWGFVMESCWGVYASFPLPPQRHLVENDAATGVQRPARMRLRRTANGLARWFNVADMESEDEAESPSPSSPSYERDDLEDSALSVTTAWQWREALLYNHGAVLLPEGERATVEFDRAYWGYASQPGVFDEDERIDML